MNIRNILDNSIAYYLTPDKDTGGGSTLGIPTVTAPTPTITDVNLEPSPAEQSQAVKAAELEAGVKGPAEIFGAEEAPEEVEERMDVAAGKEPRERDETGKFIPKPKAKKEAVKKDAAPTAPPAKPVAGKPAAAPVAKAPEPQAPAKIKIGDQEKTADEWQQFHKELADKAAAAAKPPEVKKDEPKKEPTAEEKAAEEKQRASDTERENAFITKAAETYAAGITEDVMDAILAGGKPGVTAFTKEMARVEMKARQFAAAQIESAMQEIETALGPVFDQQRVVSQYRQEGEFLAANPDIKTHAEGLATYRKLATQFAEGFQAIQQKVAAGTATAQEQLWANAYAEMTPEQMKNDLAYYTRAELKLPAPGATTEATTPETKPATAKKLTVVERPLGGDRPGGAGAPRGETVEQRLAREQFQDVA